MTDWDYTERAATYDQRAEYSSSALDKLIRAMSCNPSHTVADIGAGTGKLTRPLLDRDLAVIAIEPNDAMRSFGVKNTEGRPVTWRKANMHNTGLDDRSVAHCFFGSSFNVADQQTTLKEVSRVIKQGGYFACMWNHRDLDDPLQKGIEDIVKSHSKSNYDYGLRREDPTDQIVKSNLFGTPEFIQDGFTVEVPAKSWVDAFNSHATIARQVGDDKMPTVVNQIRDLVGPADTVHVPYVTRIWYAQAR